MTNKNNIVLVGLMGTGKSTVGQALAERLGWTFVDTDALIEQERGMAIREIFARYGEAAFRQAETETIERIMEGERQVVATGGGAVLAAANRQAMTRTGYVVRLAASAETIIERVRHDRNRPLLSGDLEQRVRAIMEERRHAYDFADAAVDTTGLDVADIVGLIVSQWEAGAVQR
ncbi:shikimate kinase [Paenibacillus ginsengihumi]|uniref:shikimate kinase n=1 Tax=Paenibacillus ginsengihumi TaxID=431596 RepID=UPI00036601CD|nr:shikimate kinase [Paenibacillus ginsengihumi]